MPGKKIKQTPDILIGLVVEALSDKKALNPVILDFGELKGAVCDAFIICHGNSSVQVEAICDHIVAEVKKKIGVAPSHVEGLENAEWVLIDYFDVVIHIFQETRRRFYNLEQLWADARITVIKTTE
ncbi:MAG: ribosome silencing factor [Bacteroidetes bacterium]|nr:ribosome silencing factor [Bacteroidota bacterium]